MVYAPIGQMMDYTIHGRPWGVGARCRENVALAQSVAADDDRQTENVFVGTAVLEIVMLRPAERDDLDEFGQVQRALLRL